MDMSEKRKNSVEQAIKGKPELNRRDMLKKYGAYTAPLVVSMLVPEQAYAMNNGVAYSTVTTCQANHTMNQATNMHCERRHPIG